MKNLRKFLLRNRIAPKWLIFLLDLTICCVAVIYANYLRLNFDFTVIRFTDMIDDLAATVVINSVFFYVFRTYHGIIRLSGFQEAFRSISAIFYSFLIMLLMNVGLSMINVPSFIPTSVLFIYFFISSFSLYGYRLLIKHLYRISVNQEDNIHVVIY